jgi:S-adenosylmethionine synthetase
MGLRDAAPLSHQLANSLCEALANARHAGEIPWLRPDCKSQVILEYKKDSKTGRLLPISIHTILISTQHNPGVTREEIQRVITEEIVKKVCPKIVAEGRNSYHY